MPQVGDKVKYIPNSCHAFDRTQEGGFVFFLKAKVTEKGKVIETTDEAAITKMLRKSTKDDINKNVTVIGPKAFWNAVIEEINEDGSADLEITHPLPGIKYSYQNVPFDGGKATLHSWHEE